MKKQDDIDKLNSLVDLTHLEKVDGLNLHNCMSVCFHPFLKGFLP
jgi:hypothetical protein